LTCADVIAGSYTVIAPDVSDILEQLGADSATHPRPQQRHRPKRTA
jgi:hypothetical protein